MAGGAKMGKRTGEVDYTLYLCTDRERMTAKTVEESVEQAVRGGVTLVQLREKNLSSRAFYETAVLVKKVTDAYQVPLIINDRADIALAVDAAGVHVGQKDIPCSEARRILGADKIVGVSAATVEEAVHAWKEGASYIGCGAMFTTDTKRDTRPVTVERLKEVCESVPIPVVAIGGISRERLPMLKGSGIAGIAVVSAIVAKPDIAKAAEEIYVDFCEKIGYTEKV